MTCDHKPNEANPRLEGSCLKCGRPVETEPTVRRDPRVEADLLDAAAEWLQRLHNKQAPHFSRTLFERLKKGAEEYGEYGFLTSDNPKEAREEPADGAGWWMLELTKQKALMPETEWLELRQIVTEIAMWGMGFEAAMRNGEAFLADFAESYS